jgi:hypothetical protein
MVACDIARQYPGPVHEGQAQRRRSYGSAFGSTLEAANGRNGQQIATEAAAEVVRVEAEAGAAR